MHISNAMAVFMTLFAAAMWGSWFQCLNHTKKFPIAGFVLVLYGVSFVLVWAVVGILSHWVLPEGIGFYLSGKASTVLLVMLGGAAMSMGLHMQLKIMGQIGMILVTALNGTFSSIFGILITILIAGLPENLSLGLVVASTVILMAASYICQYASVLRDKDNNITEGGKQATTKIVLLLILSNLLVSGYPFGMSVGTMTDTNPNGIPALLCVAFLATGSLIGVLISASVDLTRNKEWNAFLHPGTPKPIILGSISAVCHYGGNILSILASPLISPAVSFLFGRTANMWTYFWGIAYKEFAGAKKRTYFVLALGIIGYVLGVILLGRGMYS